VCEASPLVTSGACLEEGAQQQQPDHRRACARRRVGSVSAGFESLALREELRTAAHFSTDATASGCEAFSVSPQGLGDVTRLVIAYFFAFCS